jgi:undecaprenol kinase
MKRFVKSLGHALNGWKFFFAKEKNGQIQMIIAFVTILLGIILHVNSSDWVVLLLCIGLVLALEMTNSALEKIVDLLHPDQHPEIKWIKDVAAGAVLLAAIISAVIGVTIFLPKIILFLHQ